MVTGGAGFIGSNLALALEEHGARVLVVDDFSSADFRNLTHFRGEVMALDINEVEWGRVSPVDVIFHQAALTDTTVTDQKRMMFNNFEGFKKVLRYAAAHRIRFVYASSAGVYGNEPAPQTEHGRLNPLNVYAYSKLAQERLAERAWSEAKAPVIGLRYFNVYGMGERHKGKSASMIYQLAEQIRSGKRPRIFHDGEQTRDHIDVRDVVQANLKALEAKESAVVNVATGKATSFNRLIEIINAVLGTNRAPDYFENPYGFYQNCTQADLRLAKEVLGFEAKYSVEEGINEYVSSLYGLRPKPINELGERRFVSRP